MLCVLMKKIVFIIFCCIFLLRFTLILAAQDEFDFDTITDNKGLNIPVSGRLSLEGARQWNNPGRWILLGPSVNMILDVNSRIGQLYFEGLERYNLSYRIEDDPQNTREDYELEFLFRELFWKKAFHRFTFSAGRIIDVWGVMDILQIVDKVPVINRADYFFADPEEVKLGQYMMKLEYFGEHAETGFMVIPYPSFDRITDSGHPYALVKKQTLREKETNHDVEGSLYIHKTFTKGMISFYSGRFHNRTPILDMQITQGRKPVFYKTYIPYWSVGSASNVAFAPFLIKCETALNFKKPLQTGINNIPSGYTRLNQVEFGLGVDYNRGEGGLFMAEFSGTFPLKSDNRLVTNRPVFWGVLSWSNNYYNDKLRFNNILFFPESVRNLVARFQVDYYFTNTLSITTKYTGFLIKKQKEDYGFMEDYDRVEIMINYDFNLE